MPEIGDLGWCAVEKRITDWTVQGYYANVPLFGFTVEHGITQASATEEYAVLPGESIYDTLLRCGVIEDPMLDVNSYHCEWVANRWWVYRARISVPTDSRLCFEGVDGAFSVYYNNRFLGRHYNSFVPFTVDLSAYAGTSGTLLVMVECPEENLNQSGYTSKITAQRTRYDFKWDFCPRLVSLGLVAPVVLQTGPELEARIVADPSGAVSVEYSGKNMPDKSRVRFELDGQTVETCGASGCLRLQVENPRLWYCNGAGEAALYRGTLSVVAGEETLWQRDYNVGFREVRFVENEDAPAGSLPYTLTVNGEKIYIKGVNFVPIEMSRAKMTEEKYRTLLTLAKEMHVNLIRIWGGGLIETETFYNQCDRLGLLVWQDFPQSSSGIDNCATVIPAGIEALKATAESAVKRLRNHPSLAVYCGGNELMDNWVPLDFSHPNLAALKEIVDRLDGTRAMFPTTASGPNSALKPTLFGQGLHHDVHGPWDFTGSPQHYDLYNRSDCLLHGEFGVDGFCNPSAIEKMLTPAQRNLSYIAENYVWRHKAEWWNQMPRTEEIFGKAADVAEQIALSQYLQAEALRYAVEANRRRAFRNSGSIIWQFDEPYPNLCCTNLVDYFCQPKAAYYAVRQAYAAVNPNMRYDKLVYRPGEAFTADVFLTSERCGAYELFVTVDVDGLITEHAFAVTVKEAGKSVRAGTIAFEVPRGSSMRFVLEARDAGGKVYTNEIVLLIRSGAHCEKAPAIAFVERRKGQH